MLRPVTNQFRLVIANYRIL